MGLVSESGSAVLDDGVSGRVAAMRDASINSEVFPLAVVGRQVRSLSQSATGVVGSEALMPFEVKSALTNKCTPHCLVPYGCRGASLPLRCMLQFRRLASVVVNVITSFLTNGEGALSHMSRDCGDDVLS